MRRFIIILTVIFIAGISLANAQDAKPTEKAATPPAKEVKAVEKPAIPVVEKTKPAEKPATPPAKEAPPVVATPPAKEAPPVAKPAVAEKKKTDEPIKSTLYYKDNDPKDLFSWLSENYYVQFEGIDQVKGPLTLISKEMIDVQGMVKLLNEVLSKQNLEATLKDQLVAIKRVKDSQDQTIPLQYADPVKVKSILDKLYAQKANENTTTPTLIEVHPNSKAIIVRGPRAMIAEMEKYVKDQLDTPSGDNTPVAKIVKKEFTLTKLNVEETCKYLKEVYLQSGENTANKASLIIVVPNMNKIVVEGPEAVVNEIEKKLVEMEAAIPDVPEPPMQRKYVSLKYMDADEFEKLLENNEALKDKFAALKAPNNILIISTREPTIFEEIDKMQTTFDVDRMEIRYLKINHADPTKLAKLLTDVYPKDTKDVQALPEELQRVRREMRNEETSSGAGATSMLMSSPEMIQDALIDGGFAEVGDAERLGKSLSIVASGELTIVPDTERSGIIVRTFSRNFPKLLEIIDELDQPRKQVFIDVYITQVSNDNQIDVGVDWNFVGDTERKGEVIPFTMEQNFNAKTANTGLSYQIISDNLKVYLNAMEKSGKVDIISRPHLTTKDNSPAKITMGSKVPLVKSVNVNTTGIVSSAIIWEAVATDLEVTPKIHPDNYVTLKIVQKIDAISAETMQISRDFNPNIMIKRQASTELRVKDGQTICLGGFVGDEIVENIDKVPFLGDIPLIKYLFRSSSKQHIKREMIIFITPHILSSPEESLRMTNNARRNSTVEKNDDRNTDVMEEQEGLVIPKYRDGNAEVNDVIVR
ncbi:MAG: hypothetical protein JEZ07_11515 [Phycisphaerae bacterium]|nr:hypothetical protein [Phycisphaerae bacterium]